LFKDEYWFNKECVVDNKFNIFYYNSKSLFPFISTNEMHVFVWGEYNRMNDKKKNKLFGCLNFLNCEDENLKVVDFYFKFYEREEKEYNKVNNRTIVNKIKLLDNFKNSFSALEIEDLDFEVNLDCIDDDKNKFNNCLRENGKCSMHTQSTLKKKMKKENNLNLKTII